MVSCLTNPLDVNSEWGFQADDNASTVGNLVSTSTWAYHVNGSRSVCVCICIYVWMYTHILYTYGTPPMRLHFLVLAPK